MTGLHVAVFIISLLGFAGVALAMPKHGRAVFGQSLSHARRQLLRLAGWLLLAVAFALTIDRWQFDIGPVTWLGWLSVAGLVLAFALSRWAPTLKSKPETKTRSLKKEQGGELVSGGNADKDSADVRRRLPASHTLFAAAAVLIPLAWFAAQLLATPQKPLLRDDTIHGQIGPWTFSLAERDQKAPEIVAMDVPLKAFVIRFCDGCERDIRMAYFKVREPRSLRAAGNAFEGRRLEKTAEIPLPRAATLDDGLWLTVESTSGEVYHQPFDIQRLSPALARFIEEQP